MASQYHTTIDSFNMSSSAAPLDLSFGIELELLAAWPQHLEQSIHCLKIALANASIPLRTSQEVNAVANNPHPCPPVSGWSLDEDCITLSEGEKRNWPAGYDSLSIELVSRKFSYLHDDWVGEIGKVLQVLEDVEKAYGARFLTNASTGLHVHLGNGTEVLPLRTAKNLFQLTTAFEGLLDQIHPANRIATPKQEGKKKFHWHVPLSWFHRSNGQSGGSGNLYAWLASIENISSHSDFERFFILAPQYAHLSEVYFGVEKMDCGHSSAWNFMNLYRNGKEPGQAIKGTVESRQHAGTRDWQTIVHWVELLAKCVMFCHETDDTDFLSLIVQGVDPTFSLPDLLDAVGCGDETLTFYTALTRNPADPEEDPTTILPSNMATAHHSDPVFGLLLHINATEAAMWRSPALHHLTTSTKAYGTTKTITFVEIPEDAVNRMMQMYTADAIIAGDFEAEILRRFARTETLQRFGRMYEGELLLQMDLMGTFGVSFKKMSNLGVLEDDEEMKRMDDFEMIMQMEE